MTRKISLILLLVGMAGRLVFGSVEPPVGGAEAPAVAPPPSASNLWFLVGETIHYDIYWGFLHVGTSLVTTEWISHTNGQTLLRIRFDTHSNRMIERIYPVDDLQETLIDPETFLPVSYYKKSKQGRRVQHEVVYFDHAARKAYWESFTKGKTKEVDIDPDSRDLITMMYYIRQQPVKVGEQIELRVYTEEKIYDLFIKIPKEEAVDLGKYGEIPCIMYEPEAAFEGLFVRKGKMFMWVSEDERKILTKLTATIPVANIRMVLSDVSGPGEDSWVKKEVPEKTEPPSRHPHRRR